MYVGMWDGGYPHRLQESFREGTTGPFHIIIEDTDTEPTTADHPTHVAGTMVADGYNNANSEGMAELATVLAWDYGDDISEMTTAVLQNNLITISNHSYGMSCGWEYGVNDDDNWYWMAGESETTDPYFGKYLLEFSDYPDDISLTAPAGDLDALALNAPYYLIVKAAGNDRGDTGPNYAINASHFAWDANTGEWVNSTTYRLPDGGSSGYDCISPDAVAKNILTVGAVNDISNGYSNPSDVVQSSFSSWGPTDDGRIKPDIVANGVGLLSPVYHMDGDPDNVTGNSYYASWDGTSMATPTVTGSLVLLQEHYLNTHNQTLPKAATLKALVIHTANEAGNNPGPDFKNGWGLMDTKKAAEVITLDQTIARTIQEQTLYNNQPITYPLYANGDEPLKVTIVWNDPVPSTPTSNVLVNDLDLRILDENNTAYYPWRLDAANPSNAATKSDNNKDNVEQVIINNPTANALYTVQVSHKNTISSRDFSIIITGCTNVTPIVSVDVILDQRLSNGTTVVGTLKLFQDNHWTSPISAGTSMSFDVGEDVVILADQDIYSNEKYNNWSFSSSVQNYNVFTIRQNTQRLLANFKPTHSSITVKTSLEGTSATGGNIQFFDPWLIDYNDLLYDYQNRNRGMSAVFRTWPSPFIPSYGSSYQGLFEDEEFINGTYYKVKVDQTQTISRNGATHTLHFVEWDGTNVDYQASTALETGVVFQSSNASAEAVYKGTQLSNNSTAYSNNGQRKLIETISGSATWLHKVYSSMGHVWIEHSSNGGSSWTLGNNGQPLDGSAGGKNPSIAYTKGDIGYNYIGVVWQQQNGTNYKIMGKMFNQSTSSSSTPSPVSSNTILHTEYYDAYSSVDANPNLVLADGNFAPYFVTFERKSSSGLNPGINWIVGEIEDVGQAYAGSFVWEDNGWVTGTNASSINTQMSQYPNENDIAVNLVRQQGSPGTIYSHYITLSKSGSTWSYNQVNDGIISYNAHAPSIVSIANDTYSSCWIEYFDLVFYHFGNSTKYYYGNLPQSCSINRGGGSSNSGFAVWSENPGGNWSNKSIRFNNGIPVSSSLTTLSTTGRYVQIGNCPETSGYSNMYVSSFYPFSSPYYFQTTSSPLSKASTNLVSGRGFEINGDETAFSYRFEGLNVDGENIEFVDAADTADYSDLEILNKALVTEPFKISPNSKVVFTEKAGFADSFAAATMMGKEGYINYKVELVEESTGKLIGTLKSKNLSSKNSPSLKESSYALDTDGFGNSEVRLQIVLETNMISTSKERSSALEEFLQNEKIPVEIRNARKNKQQSNIVLVKSFSEENKALAKSSLNQLTVNDLNIVDSYSLEPNYPNPFNPTTTIRYQIPNASHVVLKVYDMLGKEVATLVNKNQTTGRYEVNFDASRLASGTYIYRIEAGSYTKAYKMILLK